MDAAQGAVDAGWSPLEVAVGLLRVDAPAEVMGSPESWPRWAVLLPHILAAAAFLGDAQAPGNRLMQDGSWLLDRAGTYLQVHARLDDALPLMLRAVDIAEATLGRDHPNVATRLSNLAAILRDLGRPREARPLLERALAIDEAAYGRDHPTVAARLSNLAMILRDLGRAEEAQP
jgi:tetratricopeptide (TPR) repeat protein